MLDTNFKKLITKALEQEPRETRNAITQSYFGDHLVVDSLELNQFPVLLGRKLFTYGIIGELAAFLNGPKTVNDFKEQGCNYWDAWGDENGNLNVDYGNTWIDFDGINQLKTVVESLKQDPNGRRHLITGWNPAHVKDLSLPCCHYSYQWYVNGDKLEMIWNQRSVDIMIGLPSDIVVSAVWNILMAQTVGLKPGKMHFMLGDCHIYNSHLAGVDTYFEQASNTTTMQYPSWEMDPNATVFNFVPSMLKIINYNPQPAIKFKLEVN